MGKARSVLVVLLTAVLLLGLLWDLNLPRGAIHGTPYVLLISASYWLPWRYASVVLAAIGTLLTAVGYVYSAAEVDTATVLLNVGLKAAVLWVTAFLVLRYRASSRSLEDREQRLRALVATAADGVMIIDAAGTVQEYNPACERLFGYGADEVVGHNVKMLMPPPYRDEHDQYLLRYQATGVKRIIGIGREVEGLRKDGTTFPMELSVGEARGGGEAALVLAIAFMGNFLTGYLLPKYFSRLTVQAQHGELIEFRRLGAAAKAAAAFSSTWPISSARSLSGRFTAGLGPGGWWLLARLGGLCLDLLASRDCGLDEDPVIPDDGRG